MYLHVCIDKGMIYMCIDIYIYIDRYIYVGLRVQGCPT